MKDSKDVINASLLRSELGEKFCVEYLESTTSTNDVCKMLANSGSKENTIVFAESQSAGRGRLDHTFFSPKGGIYFSLLRFPAISPSQLTLITPAAAVAVYDALAEIDGELASRLTIKYVNDLKLDGKKVCGILTEGAFSDGKLKYCVIGVGLNLYKNEYPEDIADIAGYLYEEERSGLKAELVGRICKKIVEYTDDIDILTGIQDRYNSHLERRTDE